MSESYEKPMLGGCCVCLDERGWAENPLVYCDGQMCNVAVHQACYGIVKVPDGPWFCRKCESQERAAKVKCDLCPHRDGALKRTDVGGWAHVVCSLYIPEVEFGNVSTMEPIVLKKVPPDRFHKSCYICEDESRSSKANSGACMSCAKQGCKQAFHVTCAQMSGILCEEASVGNTTKYCGYCKNHFAKMRKQLPHKSLSCSQVYRSVYSSDEFNSPEKQPIGTAGIGTAPPRFGEFRTATVASTKYVPPNNEGSIENKSQESKVISDKESHKDKVEKTVEELQFQPITPAVKSIEPSVESKPTLQPSLKYEETSNRTLSLSTLAEAASALSKQSTETPKVLLESTPSAFSPVKKDVQEHKLPEKIKEKSEPQKRKSTEGKDKETRKRNKEVKKTKNTEKKVKKEKHSKQKHEKHKSKSVSSALLSPVTSDCIGLANTPRHSVVSLTTMGSDQMEPVDAKSIGENNKIYLPDFTHDGLTMLEKFADEQKKDSFQFFQEFGMSPDVAGLLKTLQSVRDENRQLESAIDEMSHRKDQLLAIKARLSIPLVVEKQQQQQASQPQMIASPNQPMLSPPVNHQQHLIKNYGVYSQISPQRTEPHQYPPNIYTSIPLYLPQNQNYPPVSRP